MHRLLLLVLLHTIGSLLRAIAIVVARFWHQLVFRACFFKRLWYIHVWYVFCINSSKPLSLRLLPGSTSLLCQSVLFALQLSPADLLLRSILSCIKKVLVSRNRKRLLKLLGVGKR